MTLERAYTIWSGVVSKVFPQWFASVDMRMATYMVKDERGTHWSFTAYDPNDSTTHHVMETGYDVDETLKRAGVTLFTKFMSMSVVTEANNTNDQDYLDANGNYEIAKKDSSMEMSGQSAYPSK
jgi:hypothetical protein